MRTYTRAKPSWLAIALTLTINHALAGDNTDQAGDSREEKLPPLELLGFLADFSDESGWVDPAELDGMFGEQDEVPADQEAEEAVAEESKSEELLPPDDLEQEEGVALELLRELELLESLEQGTEQGLEAKQSLELDRADETGE